MVDSHDHSLGKGLPVRVAGLSIDNDLPFGGFNAKGLRSARFNAQASPLALAQDIGEIYVSGSDLWYNDTTGAQIRITASGGVAGTPGSISGMSGGAAVTYTLATKLFSFQSSSGIRAFLEAGPISIFDPVSGGKAATLSVPAGLAANYAAKLWSALPAAQKIVTLDNAGQLAAAYDVDGATLAIASSLLKIATSGVQGHLPSPVNATFTAGAGSLAAGTYYYRVTALNANGETTPSAETSLTVGASSGVNVNWGAVTGATGYKIYGRSTGAELLMATVGAVTTWLDNGSVTPSGAMPTVNTAAQQIAAGSVLGVNLANGTITGMQMATGTLQGRFIKRTVYANGASGTHTTDARTGYINVRMIGGGGGGGGVSASANPAGAGGGGSGAYAEKFIAVSPSTGYAYSAGTAGAGGSTLGGNGGAGGSSSITIGATTITAPGGSGGTGSTGTTGVATAAGGAGGSGSSNSDAPTGGAPGAPGWASGVAGSLAAYGGNGGGFWGTTGSGSVVSGAGGGGGQGVSSGGGGGGAAQTNATAFVGGNGGTGAIVIDEYTLA